MSVTDHRTEGAIRAAELQAEIAATALESNPFVTGLAVFGAYFRFVGEVIRGLPHIRHQFREFLDQAWFISSVTIIPSILMAIPFCVIIVFDTNQLLSEIGAVDLAGAGAGLAVIREIGPVASVLVVAGAGATAVCADLGSRKIREELDAMVALGINPVHRLVVPRVLASALVSVCLNGLICVTGLVGGYFFSVYSSGVTPGLYISGLTVLVGPADFVMSELKAVVFGLIAGTIACYLGMNAKGGPRGVGNAVNQTVVFTFMALFFANSVMTAVFLKIQG
ncbi:MAG TPA: ABC transporter permease [Marmoricola sp.]|nr:ABC transporter permease [Marmoricola sp.]